MLKNRNPLIIMIRRCNLILITLLLLLVFFSCVNNKSEKLHNQIVNLQLENDSLRNIVLKSIVIPINTNSLNKLAPFILSPRAQYLINDTIPIIGGIGIINIENLALKVKINDSIEIPTHNQTWSYKYKPRKVGYDTLNGEYIIQKNNEKLVLKFRQIFSIHSNREQLIESLDPVSQ